MAPGKSHSDSAKVALSRQVFHVEQRAVAMAGSIVFHVEQSTSAAAITFPACLQGYHRLDNQESPP